MSGPGDELSSGDTELEVSLVMPNRLMPGVQHRYKVKI